MNWDEVVVRLDNRELGRTDRTTLYNGGVDFALPDATALHLSLENDIRGYPLLYATRNGMPLPGSGGDPLSQIQLAAWLMLLAGVPQIFVGMTLTGDAPRESMAFAAAGIALSLLALFTFAHSFPATVIGAVAMTIETLVLIATKFTAADAPRAFLLLMIVGWIMGRGIGAAHHLDHVRLPVRRPPQPFHRD